MAKDQKFERIVSINTLEKIQETFSMATEIPCVVRSLKGEALTKITNPSKLWLEVIKHPEIEKQVINMFNINAAKCVKTGQIIIFQRYLDLYTFIVPLNISGKVKAVFVGGLVRFGNPNIELCEQEAIKLGIELDTFLEMYLSLTLFTKEKFEACANLLRYMATTISNLSQEGKDLKQELKEKTEEFERTHSNLNIDKSKHNVTFSSTKTNSQNY